MNRSTSPFVEKLGLVVEREGRSRVSGQLLGILLLADAPLSLDELAARLAVSKASVSINARELERHGVAMRVSFPGDRRDHYVIAADLPANTMRERIASLRRFRDAIAAGSEETRSGNPLVRNRFTEFVAAFEHTIDSMEHVLAELVNRAGDRSASGSRADADANSRAH
ncbi:MAG: GbsR/MarR family transcriptional regulator [Gemmatimonadaceae bacterium]